MRRLVFAAVAMVAIAGCGPSARPHWGPKPRRYTFRAIGGASMGAMSAAQLGLRYADMFDIIAPSGGALDLGMLIHWFRDGMLGGFCVPPELGKMCPAEGQTQDYEHMDCGGPSGGGFDRESMIETFQDMFIAYGNLASFNPGHHYLPAGMDPEWMKLDRQTKCSQPLVLEGYYDWQFNPEGKYPVITYCEADGPEQCVFDPSVEPRFPVDITYAVDLNGNGRRDSGEPVIFRLSERYDDTGEDGLFDYQEPGYDPEENPDPNGDDYHPLENPLGTENNHLYDVGEPFLDYGLDGVEGTADSPYDWGEGNGLFDYNPHVLRTAIMFDPSRLVQNLSLDQLDRLDFYIDVGVRDHLGFKHSCEAFVGKLAARGRHVDVRHRFESVLEPDYEGPFDIAHVDWDNIGRDLMIIYGNPDATQEEIEAGDGGHVGNASQAVWRFHMILAFVSARWPDGDFEVLRPPRDWTLREEHYHSDILGRDRSFSVFLPPGYDEQPEKRYPVLYLLHGIGMRNEDLTAAAIFAGPWMNQGIIQKFIIVFPDGRCSDDCNSGTFYANQLGRSGEGNRYEDEFIQEVIPIVEERFRTRESQVIE